MHLIVFGRSSSNSVIETKKIFLELITKRTGDEKVKAKMIVNLLRNFCPKSYVNTCPSLLKKS